MLLLKISTLSREYKRLNLNSDYISDIDTETNPNSIKEFNILQSGTNKDCVFNQSKN